MTVLNLHKEERLKIAKEVLGKNIQNPIVVKGPTNKEGEVLLIFIDGKILAEKLELKVKNELEKSDLSNTYLVELDFDNSNTSEYLAYRGNSTIRSCLDNNSLYFEKIMDSSIFYRVPSIIADSEEEMQELKTFIDTETYSSEDLRKTFRIVELDVKTELESLELTINSSKQTEFVLYDLMGRTGNERVGSFQQHTFSNETPFDIPDSRNIHFEIKRIESKLGAQFLSKKKVTVEYSLPKYSNYNIVGVFLNAFSKEKEQIIEYQTIAELNAEQSSFVNWAKGIVETVDEHIRQFDKLYYTEEELKDMIS